MHETLLRRILSQPSAPFREAHVKCEIEAALEGGGVPYFTDPIGNIVVGASSKAEYLRILSRRSCEPVRLFIAHMDHPGFHGAKWKSDRELEVLWHGGSPTKHLEGARVWLASSASSPGLKATLAEGVMAKAELLPSGRAIRSATIETPASLRRQFRNPRELFGGFTFREFVWREGDLLYTKAADDLVGAFCVLSLALRYCKRGGSGRGRARAKSRPSFLGLLTRAEEVGFIGCIGHFEQGWLRKAKRPVLCVSLETSRTLPGAEIGKGPVVRLGDRFTVFDAGALRTFSEIARKALGDSHQRRIMDGGTCEATVATAYGFPSVGISVPLGNYHNQSFEGGPDASSPNGPAPEFVHVGDVEGLLKLGDALLKPGLSWNDPWSSKRRELTRGLKKYRRLLSLQ